MRHLVVYLSLSTPSDLLYQDPRTPSAALILLMQEVKPKTCSMVKHAQSALSIDKHAQSVLSMIKHAQSV
jgi:hypothetical protein